MDIELFKKVMKELSPYLYNVNLYFQGEPMLHPSFFSFVDNCRKLIQCVFQLMVTFFRGKFRTDCDSRD